MRYVVYSPFNFIYQLIYYHSFTKEVKTEINLNTHFLMKFPKNEYKKRDVKKHPHFQVVIQYLCREIKLK